ncbi:MAG: hypothetical protein RL265_1328, partial [Bacteroidota bacterium]
WAKDGLNDQIYIVQARPETIHGLKNRNIQTTYKLLEKSKILARGIALGDKIATGKARFLESPAEGHKLQKGEILIADFTNPDWDPILKKAAGIVTNKGGRTSHAAIIARELNCGLRKCFGMYCRWSRNNRLLLRRQRRYHLRWHIKMGNI